MNTNETKPRSGGVPGEASYPGPAVAYGANGSSATVNSSQYAVPVEAQFKKTVAVKNEFQGYRPAYTPSLVAAGPAPMPMPVPYDERTGLVWGIAVLGMFVFIFSVTVIILLFTISFENNQIASSILSGLSAIFVLVMIGLLFRYDRLSGNTADVVVADQQQPIGVVAAAPMPVEAAPMVVSAPPPPPPPPAPAPPADVSADIPPPPAPEVGGYYYGYGQGANQYNNYPRYPASAYYR